MAPERIEPGNSVYDIRADVWSVGITLVELATGEYPFREFSNSFHLMCAIIQNDPPELKGDNFSLGFKEFVKTCLIKEVDKRPKFKVLLQNPFVQLYKTNNVDVKEWFNSVVGGLNFE